MTNKCVLFSVFKMALNAKVYTFETCRQLIENKIAMFKVTLSKGEHVLQVVNYDRVSGSLLLDKKSYGDFDRISVRPVTAEEMKDEGYNDEFIFICTACNNSCDGLYYFTYDDDGDRYLYADPYELNDEIKVYHSKVKLIIADKEDSGWCDYTRSHTSDEESSDYSDSDDGEKPSAKKIKTDYEQGEGGALEGAESK